MPKSIFFPREGRGFEPESVTDTRATDKNDPFLNMGFKHTRKSGWTKMGQIATWSSGV